MDNSLEQMAEEMIQAIERKEAQYTLRVELAGDQLVLYTHGLMVYLEAVGDSPEKRKVFKNKLEEPSGKADTRMGALLLDYLRFYKSIPFESGNKGEILTNALDKVVKEGSPVLLYLRDPKDISTLHIMTPEEVESLDYIEIRQEL